MQAQRTFKGANLEDLLEEVRTEVGATAKIVHVDKVREGGIMGFFPKEFYEVTVAGGSGDDRSVTAAVEPGTQPAPPAGITTGVSAPVAAAPRRQEPRAPMPTSAADLADIVNTAERLQTTPPTTTMPAAGDDPAGTAFGRELRKAIHDVDHARLAAAFGVQSPEPAPNAIDSDDDAADDHDSTFVPFGLQADAAHVVARDTPAVAEAAPDLGHTRPPALGGLGGIGAGGLRPSATAGLDSVARNRPVRSFAPDRFDDLADDVADAAETGIRVDVEGPPARPLADETLVRRRDRQVAGGRPPAPIGAGLLALGLPAEFLPEGLESLGHPAAIEAALAGSLTSLPVADTELGPGDIAVVVGDRAGALALAREVAIDLGCDPDGVILATPDTTAGEVLAWMRVTSPAIARRRLPTWQRREAPTVVALEAPLGDCRPDWVRAVLGELCPSFVLALADATTKPADVATWVQGLDGVDALALTRTAATSTPASVLSLHVPVATLDGAAATASRWAELLVGRLAYADTTGRTPMRY